MDRLGFYVLEDMPLRLSASAIWWKNIAPIFTVHANNALSSNTLSNGGNSILTWVNVKSIVETARVVDCVKKDKWQPSQTSGDIIIKDESPFFNVLPTIAVIKEIVNPTMVAMETELELFVDNAPKECQSHSSPQNAKQTMNVQT